MNRGVRVSLAVLWAILACLCARGFAQTTQPRQEAGLVVKSVEFNLLDNDLFPVVWCHLLGRDFKKGVEEIKENYPHLKKVLEETEKKLGEGSTSEDDLAKITLVNTGSRVLTGVRVEVSMQEGYSEPAIDTVNINPGSTVVVKLTPAFSDKIFKLAEQKPTSIYIKVTDADGKVVYEKTRKITILSKNDMVWMSKVPFDTASGIVTFVTPHDSKKTIDRLLSYAANMMPTRSLGGYQEIPGLSHVQVVELQAQAIYNTLQYTGVKYVNTPLSFGKNAQRIKFPSESLLDLSGNCIEGTLVFASAFESLGMRPLIFLVPHHAFVGVRAWYDDYNFIVIETTMVGTSPYTAAREAAMRTYLKYRNSPECRVIDIELLRMLGITPAPE